MNRLSKGEKLLGAASALLLILSFVPMWATYESEGIAGLTEADSERYSAWGSEVGFGSIYPFYTKLAIFLAALALLVVIVRAVAPQVADNVPFPLAYVYLGLTGLAALLLLLTTVTGPEEGGALGVDVGDFGVEVSRGILLYVGLALSLAAAAGAFVHMQEEGTSRAAPGPLGRGPAGPGPAGPGPAGPPPPPGPGL